VIRHEQQRLQEQLWRARIDLGDRDVRAPSAPASPKRVCFDAWRAWLAVRDMGIARRFRAAAHASAKQKLSGFQRWLQIYFVQLHLDRLALSLLRQRARRALLEWSSHARHRQCRLEQRLGGAPEALPCVVRSRPETAVAEGNGGDKLAAGAQRSVGGAARRGHAVATEGRRCESMAPNDAGRDP
jgi:hypothetical protein